MTARTDTPTILELFAGAGGLALGLERAGLKARGLIEFDADCVRTLQKNRPDWPVFHADVKDVDYTPFQGVDILSGGFPCQAFSSAGKRLGFQDERGNLFFEMMRAIRCLQPKIVLAENVQGLLNHNKGQTLETILDALRGVGYTVYYELFNAVDFGVPQKRKRLIIIAVRGQSAPRPLMQPLRPIRTLADALKGCPESEGMAYSANKERIMRMIPQGGCWTALPDDIQREYMGASYGHGSAMGGRRGMARRMAWSEPSLTILCSPSQKQTERCHPEETRPFTVRESARIQTFPDDWIFTGSVSSQYRQIGNAVPVDFAEAIGKHVLQIFQEGKFDATPRRNSHRKRTA